MKFNILPGQGLFGTAYTSTHTHVNLQKTFYIHCANLAFLLLLVLDYQPGPFSFILSLLLYSSFTFIISLCPVSYRILQPVYHNPDIYYLPDFLLKYLLDFYQIFLCLPDFLPDMYLISAGVSVINHIQILLYTIQCIN